MIDFGVGVGHDRIRSSVVAVVIVIVIVIVMVGTVVIDELMTRMAVPLEIGLIWTAIRQLLKSDFGERNGECWLRLKNNIILAQVTHILQNIQSYVIDALLHVQYFSRV
jgi:hypothetical protein